MVVEALTLLSLAAPVLAAAPDVGQLSPAAVAPAQASGTLAAPAVVSGTTVGGALAPAPLLATDAAASATLTQAAFVPPPGPPPAEALVAIGADGAASISWLPSPAVGILGYNVYRSTREGEYSTVPVNRSLVTGTEFLDALGNSIAPPENGTTYWYTVRAVDEQGRLSGPSEEARARPEGAPVISEIPKVDYGFGESQLSVSGRKVVSLGYTIRTPKNTPGTSQLSGAQNQRLDLQQQLQVRLNGTVGKKITVDVDYDDTAPDTTRQRISVVYAGEPTETIERAEFGDIRLQLSDTEFTGYDKQLFGIRIQAKPVEKLRVTAVATQTQGINATEQFIGSNSKQEITLSDNQYVTNRYFYLTNPYTASPYADAGGHIIKPGYEQIWLDDGNPANNPPVGSPGYAYVGGLVLELLRQGVDYSIDYTTGVVVFNRNIDTKCTVAAAFLYGNGTPVTFSGGVGPTGFPVPPVPADLCTLRSNWDISTTYWGQTTADAHLMFDGPHSGGGDAHMITNRYQLGYRNIVPKDFDPEFTIRVYDAQGNEILGVAQPVLNSDFYDFGVLTLQGHRDHPGTTILPCGDPRRIYFPDRVSTGTICGPAPACSAFDEFAEPPGTEQPFAWDDKDTMWKDGAAGYARGGNAYQYGTSSRYPGARYQIKMRFLTRIASYRLRNISIVRGSERITLDGRILQRDVDYFFDYDFGQVTFLRPEQIRYDSRIQVDYEYLPFGGQFQSFLWGTRAQYTLTDKTGIGGTYLSNTAQAPQDVPSPTAAPKATSIAGLDGRTFLSRNDLSQVVRVLPGFQKTVLPLEMELRGEVARSDINPNSFNPSGSGERGVAMIDGMEGVDDTVETGVESSSWFPVATPDAMKVGHTRTTRLAWKTEQGGHFSDIARTLDLHYEGLVDGTWEGLRYNLSPVGLDLTNYQYLEMWVWVGKPGTDPDPKINLHVSLGVVSEDSNGDAILNSEDKNGDFVLNGTEDTGINNDGNAFWGANGAITLDDGHGNTAYPGPGGTLLNTEDMNGNGVLDQDNRVVDFAFPVDQSGADANGWKFVKIPISFTGPAGDLPSGFSGASRVTKSYSALPPDKAVVRHVGLWLEGTPGGQSAGHLRVETLQVTGNRWLLRTTPGTNLAVDSSRFNVSAISQEINTGYQPLLTFFQVRETGGERREQSLDITYNLYDDAGGNYFASRAFPSPINLLDYDELRFDIQKINSVNNNNGEFLFLRAGGDDRNYYQFNVPLDKLSTGWQTVVINLRDLGARSKVGAPTLSGAKQFSFGVIRYDPPTAAISEELWINNLRVVSPHHKIGIARKVNVRASTPMGSTFIVDPNQEILPANAGIIVDTTYRELDNDFRTLDQPTFLQGDQHHRSVITNAQVRQIPKLPLTLNATRDTAYVEDHHRDDPLFYFSPDRTAQSYQATVASEHFRPLAVDVSANRNEEDVRYLTNVAGADYNRVAWSAAPQIRAPLDGSLFLVPLGSNGEARATARYTKERLDYAPSTVFLNLVDRTSESLDEQYDARTSYRPLWFLKKPVPILSGFTTAPRMGYHLNRTSGIVGSVQVANIADPNSINSANRFVPVRQEITAGLDNRLDSLKGLTPSANYSASAQKDFTVQNLTTRSSLLNSLDIRPGEWWKFLMGQTFNVSYTIETGAQYYDQTTGTGLAKKTVEPVTKQVPFRQIWWIDRKDDLRATSDSFAETYVVGGRMEFFHAFALTPNWSFREDTTLQQKLRQRNTLTTAGAGFTLIKSELVTKLFAFTPVFWMKIAGFDSTYNFRKNIRFDFKDRPTHVTETHQATASTGFAPIKNMTGNLTCAFDRSIDFAVPAVRTITQSIRPSVGLGYSRSAGVEIPLIWWKLKLSNLFTVRHTFQMNFIDNVAVGQLTGNRQAREISDFTEFEYEMLKGINLRFRTQFDQVQDFTEPQKNFRAYSFFGTFLFNF